LIERSADRVICGSPAWIERVRGRDDVASGVTAQRRGARVSDIGDDPTILYLNSIAAQKRLKPRRTARPHLREELALHAMVQRDHDATSVTAEAVNDLPRPLSIALRRAQDQEDADLIFERITVEPYRDELSLSTEVTRERAVDDIRLSKPLGDTDPHRRASLDEATERRGYVIFDLIAPLNGGRHLTLIEIRERDPIRRLEEDLSTLSFSGESADRDVRSTRLL
jgi:hypothetical protein